MYRSRQKEYMDDLKSNVLHVTKGLDKEDRKFALDYLRRHVKIDDLHRSALKEFPQKTIIFGSGSHVARIVILTKDPIQPQAQEQLDKVWEKMKIQPHDVYYAHLRFVATKKKQEQRQDILTKLLEIINPTVILSFDGLKVETTKEWIDFPHPLSILTASGHKDEKRLLTQKLKEVRRLIQK